MSVMTDVADAIVAGDPDAAEAAALVQYPRARCHSTSAPS